jgi:uncharacterized RDD family membrane protein YckC
MATGTTPRAEVSRVGFFARLAAYVVDVLTTWVLAGIVGGGLWALATAAGATEATAMAMLPLSAIVAVVTYYTVLHAHGRQTVGKRLIGAVVVDTDLRSLGHLRSLGRLMAEILSAIPFNLGYLWALWDPERQTLHDKIASTLVVRDNDLPD